MLRKWTAQQGIKYYQEKYAPKIFECTKDDPEKAHEEVVKKLRRYQCLPLIGRAMRLLTTPHDKRLNQKICGLTFPNPIGLAAGFDKGAQVFPALSSIGFGFIEVGTITGLEQPGNERPRIWRYPEQECLINCMGFNNEGAKKIAARLAVMRQKFSLKCPLGINIGKSKDTKLEDAPAEYADMLRLFFPLGDYFVVNVSSPNTEGLRMLQHKKSLKILLETLKNGMFISCLHNEPVGQTKPLFLKIAPDLTFPELDEILAVCDETKIDGIIATNTTIERQWLGADVKVPDRGGLSGHRELFEKALSFVRHIRKQFPTLPIIGVGGIKTVEQAFRMLQFADLIQVYTALIFQGPFLVSYLNQGLLEVMKRKGINSILKK